MIRKLLLTIVLLTLTVETMAINPEAEKYISKMLDKKTPYQVKVLDYDFIINSVNAYPPGNLTAMFAKYLLDNNLVKDKVVADIGCGCFALGIIAAKNGANTIICTDINEHAIRCAKDNLALNDIHQPTYVFHQEGVSPLYQKFKGKVDLLVSGVPWDSISSNEFETIKNERKPISRSFYDVDDKLIDSVMSEGFDLLSPEGKMFITSSMRTLERIKELCTKYGISYKIVREEDLHKDGNMHYIIELSRNSNEKK